MIRHLRIYQNIFRWNVERTCNMMLKKSFNNYNYGNNNNSKTFSIDQILSAYPQNRIKSTPDNQAQNLLSIRSILDKQKKDYQSSCQFLGNPNFKLIIKDIQQNFKKIKFRNQVKIIVVLKDLKIQKKLCNDLKQACVKQIQKINFIQLLIFLKQLPRIELQPEQFLKVQQRLQQFIKKIETKNGQFDIRQSTYRRPMLYQPQNQINSKAKSQQILNILTDRQYWLLIKGVAHNLFKHTELLIKIIYLGISQKNIKNFDIINLVNTYISIVSSLGEQDFKNLQKQLTMMFNRIVLEFDQKKLNEVQIGLLRKLFQVIGRYCYIFKKRTKNQNILEQEQINVKEQIQQHETVQNQMLKRGQVLLDLILKFIMKQKNLIKRKDFWSTCIQVFGRLGKFDQKLWNQLLQQAFKTAPDIKELQFMSIGITFLPVKQRRCLNLYQQKMWQLVWKNLDLMKERQRLKFIQICMRSIEKGIQIKIPQSINISEFNQLLQLRKKGKPIKSTKKEKSQKKQQSIDSKKFKQDQ